ncbi:extracellular solute-binding protein [Butyrivibrio sp. MC2013]|uniref:extracellular solute-binding protein n=1 Tax=Butyrivibrio sp. MC2013 TaxID=1280686 RepID=UPI0003FDB485|nr:extracellular solute-binding protein [Butyrivibrio sp. MC2013]
MKKFLERFYMGLILVFMYLPIVTMIVLSFNASKSRARWGGFTFKWYLNLFGDSEIINALANTMTIALISTLVATVIGTLTCVALMGVGRKSRAFIMGITNIPMINADIVTGISLMLLFRFLHMNTGFITVLIAHITFNIPYVMLSVMPRMKTINPSVYEAALDLGAEPFFAFRKTILPDLMPAVLSGAMMAFTMSLDDFIITYFTKGSGFDTLSTKIYNEVKRGIQPEIYALSAIIFLMVIVIMLGSRIMRYNKAKRAGSKEDSYAAKKRLPIGKTIAVIALAVVMITAGLVFGGVFRSKSNQVYVYNWGEYIDPEVIEIFQEETGIEVVYDEFESNEIMYAKLASDGAAYDVVCPSDYMISKLIGEDMLSPLDWDELPYAKENLDEAYMQSAAQFDPGNKYTIPNFCGTVGILYNKTMVDGPVNSWDILWDPKYKGSILMQDSVRDAFMVALARNGYSINSTDRMELEKAAADLIAQKPLVQAYVIDQVRDKMIGGEAALGVIYSGEAVYTQRENPDLEYVIPDEGSNVWLDGWCITKDARHKENALKWINFLCREDIALKNFEFVTYTTPNKKAQELIEDESIKNSEVAFPSEESLSNCEVYQYLGNDADKIYNDLWKKVKAAE